MVIRSTRKDDARRLSETLASRRDVLEFQIKPTGD